MASTVVIFSGCSPKNDPVAPPDLRIGVTTDLLSFDPFSFQSLGERDITDLIYGSLFIINNEKLSSKYLKNIKIEKGALVFDKVEGPLFLKIKSIFDKGNESVLWKDVFSKFKLEETRISYLEKKDFIAQLKTLSSLIVFKGDGPYRIEKFIKGQRVNLLAKTDDIVKRLAIIRVKDNKTGLDLVKSKDLDLYYPSRPFEKGVIQAYKGLRAIKSEEFEMKLRLYQKFGVRSSLEEVYCKNKSGFLKVLGEGWVLEKDACNLKGRRKASSTIIYSDRYNLKFLDFLYDHYQKQVGGSFSYKMLKSSDLTNTLKMGQFDQHLSLEKIGRSTPVFYDSFHTEGRYNTYRVRDSNLDEKLIKSSESINLKGFYAAESEARNRLLKILPVVFSYSRPAITYVKRKDFKSFQAKPSKRLIFFKK